MPPPHTWGPRSLDSESPKKGPKTPQNPSLQKHSLLPHWGLPSAFLLFEFDSHIGDLCKVPNRDRAKGPKVCVHIFFLHPCKDRHSNIPFTKIKHYLPQKRATPMFADDERLGHSMIEPSDVLSGEMTKKFSVGTLGALNLELLWKKMFGCRLMLSS